MSDYDPDSTASNYSIQPGKSVDYPSQGKAMDPADHPSTSMPDATDHHDGTVLGTDLLKRAFATNKATGGKMQSVDMGAADNIGYIAGRR